MKVKLRVGGVVLRGLEVESVRKNREEMKQYLLQRREELKVGGKVLRLGEALRLRNLTRHIVGKFGAKSGTQTVDHNKISNVGWKRKMVLVRKLAKLIDGKGRAARDGSLREWAREEIKRRRWTEEKVRRWAVEGFRSRFTDREEYSREKRAEQVWARYDGAGAEVDEDGNVIG